MNRDNQQYSYKIYQATIHRNSGRIIVTDLLQLRLKLMDQVEKIKQKNELNNIVK
jgi:hypothetical protein